MHTDGASMTDSVAVSAGYGRKPEDLARVVGWVEYELRGPDGEVKLYGVERNIITEYGDQMYGELLAGIGSNNVPTGMRLGTGGATAAAKTGAGAAIVTYVSGSEKAFEGAYPQSALDTGARKITWRSIWAAGDATANGIDEAVLTNETPLTDVAGAAGNTIARVVLSPVINKGVDDTLTLTWNHTFQGT